MRLRARFGDYEIISLTDAIGAAVAPTLPFPDTTAEAWREAGVWLTPNGELQPDLGCFLLRGPNRVILVDAGIGPGPVAYLGGLRGSLSELLKAEGVAPEDIDQVVFTHAHFDHVGWAAAPDGAPRFPRADYVMAEAEWAFWTSPETEALEHHRAAFAANMLPLAQAGRLRRVATGANLGHGLSYLPLPGHTPGHCGVLVSAIGATGLIAGDALHTPAQIARPDFSHRADKDRVLARTSREKLIERLAREGWLLACGHFPIGRDIGHVVADQDGRPRWRVVAQPAD